MSSGYVSIAAFGAVGDGRTDNQAAIQNAFDYAHAHGLEVFVPRGVFSRSGTLTANGITVFGTGNGSVLHGTDPSRESLYLHGSGATVSSLELTTEAGPRLSSPDCTAICADHCTNYRIANITIEHSGSAVIMNYGSDHGTIINNTVLDTNADSIHMIDGAHDITVQGNLVERSGDDSISVINYGTDSSGSTNITIKGNTILDQQWGRGITVAGGHAIAIVGNHVEGGPADRAGIYISAESACSTPGNYGITVEGNTLKGAGGAQSGQGAIMVWNGEGGSITNHNIAITNNEIDAPRKDGILIIGSPQASLVVEHNTVYAPHGAAVDVADAPINSAIAGNPVLSQASYRGDIVPARRDPPGAGQRGHAPRRIPASRILRRGARGPRGGDDRLTRGPAAWRPNGRAPRADLPLVHFSLQTPQIESSSPTGSASVASAQPLVQAQEWSAW